MADLDPTEFIEALEEHLKTLNKDNLSIKEAMEASLLVYSEASLKDIEELEAKLDEDEPDLDEDEENLLYFK